MKKKFLMVLLTVMASFAVFTINASAATASGNCGPSDSPTSVTWTMDTVTGTLTISGSGLNISHLNQEEGRLVVDGEFDAIEYSGKTRASKGGFLGRILR